MNVRMKTMAAAITAGIISTAAMAETVNINASNIASLLVRSDIAGIQYNDVAIPQISAVSNQLATDDKQYGVEADAAGNKQATVSFYQNHR